MCEFFQEYDQLTNDVSKFLRTKKSIYEKAALFSKLSAAQSNTNPFESALSGISKYGEMQCYSRVDDKPKTIQTAISAARLYIKTAEYNFHISKILKETWYDHLSDALQCYRIAVDLLNEIFKPYLAVTILQELGNVLLRFDLIHASANTFEEACDLSIQQKLPLPLLFNSLTAGILSYSRISRYDLALQQLLKAEPHYFDDEIAWISPSPVVKRHYHDLLVYHYLLLIANFKFDEAHQYLKKEFKEPNASILDDILLASKNSQVFVLEKCVKQAKENDFFSPGHIQLLGHLLISIMRSVEQTFASIA